jgi:hypothetical protein
MSRDFLVYGAAGGAVGVLGVMAYGKSTSSGGGMGSGMGMMMWIRAALYGTGMGLVTAMALSYTPLAGYNSNVAPFLGCVVVPPVLTFGRMYMMQRQTPVVSAEVPV